MPISATLKYFSITTSLKLYYQHWIPEKPKAFLIYAHDIGDHIGRHGNLVKYFTERGYAVALYDQRGHGRSGGNLSSDGDFSEFVNDLSCFIHFSREAIPKGTPIFVIGHGVGAQFVINLLVPGFNSFNSGIVAPPGKISGFITISAFIEPSLKSVQWKERFEEKMARFYPSFPVRTIVNPTNLSLNTSVVEAYCQDPLVTKKVPLKLQRQIFENTQILMAMATRMRTPALMLHGKEDLIASSEGTRNFFSRLPLFTNQLHIYDDLLHELTNDQDKDLVFADMEAWLEKIVTSLPQKKHNPKENLCDLPLFSS